MINSIDCEEHGLVYDSTDVLKVEVTIQSAELESAKLIGWF